VGKFTRVFDAYLDKAVDKLVVLKSLVVCYGTAFFQIALTPSGFLQAGPGLGAARM